MAKAQAAITKRTAKQVEKQFKKYYLNAMKKAIADFEGTYNQYLNALADGREPSPATLYKLDKYWQSQAQLRNILQNLGEKQAKALSEAFELQFFDIYYSIALQGSESFNTIDKSAVQQMINQIWCADGKSWSQRIWENTELLADTLNEELIHCVTTGKKTTELKKLLTERFNVSYGRADALVRTELAHIQTQAAQQRYKDYGLKEVEIWADEDERRCDVCGKLHKTRYPVGAKVPIPAHPRCRCCIVPVVEGAKDTTFTNICEDCGDSFTTYNEATRFCNKCKNKRWKTYNRID
jgi:SPP1 gp7 family putative phage head morphogenesis protein